MPSLVWQSGSVDAIAATLAACNGRVAAALRLATPGPNKSEQQNRFGPWAVTCLARLRRMNALISLQDLKSLLHTNEQQDGVSRDSIVHSGGRLGLYFGIQRFLLQLLLLPPPVSMPVKGWASPTTLGTSGGRVSGDARLVMTPARERALESIFRVAVCLLDDLAKQLLFNKCPSQESASTPAVAMLCAIAGQMACHQAQDISRSDSAQQQEIQDPAVTAHVSASPVTVQHATAGLPSSTVHEPAADDSSHSRRTSAMLLGWSMLQLASRVMGSRCASRVSMSGGGPLCLETASQLAARTGAGCDFPMTADRTVQAPPQRVNTLWMKLASAGEVFGVTLCAPALCPEAAPAKHTNAGDVGGSGGGAGCCNAVPHGSAGSVKLADGPSKAAGCIPADLVSVVEGCCEGFQVDSLDMIDGSLLYVAVSLLHVTPPASAQKLIRTGHGICYGGAGGSGLSYSVDQLSRHSVVATAAADALQRVLWAALNSRRQLVGGADGRGVQALVGVAGSADVLDLHLDLDLALDDDAVAHAEQLASVVKQLVGVKLVIRVDRFLLFHTRCKQCQGLLIKSSAQCVCHAVTAQYDSNSRHRGICDGAIITTHLTADIAVTTPPNLNLTPNIIISHRDMSLPPYRFACASSAPSISIFHPICNNLLCPLCLPRCDWTKASTPHYSSLPSRG